MPSSSYLEGATGPIPSALSRPSSLLLDGTGRNKDCQASNRDTNTDQEVPQKRSFDGKCTDNSFSTTQRSSTRSTTAGSVSRPRSTSSSRRRRPFGEIKAESASISWKAPLVGVLADRSLLRRLSVYGFYAAAKAQPSPRVVLAVLTRRLPVLRVDVEFDPLENVSHFKATTLLGGARKSTVFFGIKAEICGPPNVSFQQLVDSRDIAKSVLDASSKRINVKFYKHLPAPSGTPSYYLSGSWRFPSSPRVSSVGTFAQPIEPSFAVPGIF
jgi:hypothetical protein